MPGMRLYIGNLPWVTAEDELRETFAQCGPLAFLEIPTGRQGRSRGYGIVEYVNDQDAINAVPALNGHMIGNRAITVREDKVGPTTTEQRPSGNGNGGAKNADGAAAGKRNRANRTVMKTAPPMDGCRCYLGNLSWQTTNEELQAHCMQAGTVTAAQVAYQKSGRSKGWGLVDFATAAEAETAIPVLHNSEIGGRAVICRLERPADAGGMEGGNAEGGAQQQPRGDRKQKQSNREPQPERTGVSSGCQVVVRNLPWQTTSQDLREVFQQVGAVMAAEAVCHADTGRSKGWGTVTFGVASEAEAAVQGFNGIALMGREMQVKIDRFA